MRVRSRYWPRASSMLGPVPWRRAAIWPEQQLRAGPKQQLRAGSAARAAPGCRTGRRRARPARYLCVCLPRPGRSCAGASRVRGGGVAVPAHRGGGTWRLRRCRAGDQPGGQQPDLHRPPHSASAAVRHGDQRGARGRGDHPAARTVSAAGAPGVRWGVVAACRGDRRRRRVRVGARYPGSVQRAAALRLVRGQPRGRGVGPADPVGGAGLGRYRWYSKWYGGVRVRVRARNGAGRRGDGRRGPPRRPWTAAGSATDGSWRRVSRGRLGVDPAAGKHRAGGADLATHRRSRHGGELRLAVRARQDPAVPVLTRAGIPAAVAHRRRRARRDRAGVAADPLRGRRDGCDRPVGCRRRGDRRPLGRSRVLQRSLRAFRAGRCSARD